MSRSEAIVGATETEKTRPPLPGLLWRCLNNNPTRDD